jgi:Cu(I)/Ag(I) efflux system protein CusF
MKRVRIRLWKLAPIFVAAIIVGSGVTNVEAFDSPGRRVLAQTAEKLIGEGEGVIKGINVSDRKLLITHGPISGALEMPSMTMAFRVAPDVDLASLAPRAKVKFTLSRDAKGLYVIEKIRRVD